MNRFDDLPPEPDSKAQRYCAFCSSFDRGRCYLDRPGQLIESIEVGPNDFCNDWNPVGHDRGRPATGSMPVSRQAVSLSLDSDEAPATPIPGPVPEADDGPRRQPSSNAEGSGIKEHEGKPPMEYLPMDVLQEVAWAFKFGANKYGKDNWREYKREDYPLLIGAALRHITAVPKPHINSFNTESGTKHLAHAIASLLMAMNIPEDES